MSVRRWRVPRPSEDWFGSRLRSVAVAARVGRWLGICFGVAFLTGLISHYAQAAHQPVPFPTRPAWGYRVTQGLHIVSGTAAIPLLLVKLWAVYPRLFQAMPRRLPDLLRTTLERTSIAVLVAGSILQLAIGVMNVAQWYAWDFSFKRTHYALAWIVIGALLVHLAVKLPLARRTLAADLDDAAPGEAASDGAASDGAASDGAASDGAVAPAGVLSRRGLLRSTGLAVGATVVVTTATAGTLPVLDRLAVLAPRSRRGGIPINRTASQVGVVAAATSADYRCEVAYAGRTASFSRSELAALPQSTHTLPIACVEGWSVDGRWSGVPLRVLLDHLGVPRGRDVEVVSLQQRGPDRRTLLPANFVDDARTLLALMLDGRPLALDHGYPVRLIAPDRPGALQTKWIARIEVL